MRKEEKIQEAWAGYYNPQVKENGWMNIRPGTYANEVFFDRIKFNSERDSIRPKSLQGIEDNNGWVKIESEADLPKEGNIFWVMKIGYSYPIVETLYNNDAKYWMAQFTHYQPIIKPKPPIY